MASDPIPQSKVCTKCGVDRPLSDYCLKPGGRNGRDSRCTPCKKTPEARRKQREYKRKYRESPHVQEAMARFRQTGQYKQYMAAYEASSERIARRKERESTEQYREKRRQYESRPERLDSKRKRDKSKARREKKKIADAIRHSRPDNKALRAERMCKYRRTPRGALETAMRRGLYEEIVKGSKRGRCTFGLLGFTVEELKAHLERQFMPGMNWENYGRRGWHIDHRVPLASFSYQTPDDAEFAAAWALTNLQPLWWQENLSKSDSTNLLL